MMVRRWGHRLVIATRSVRTCQNRQRSIDPRPLLHDPAVARPAPGSTSLHVGVLGLGAIGTILFTRLGLLASKWKGPNNVPTFTVDAFIRETRFDQWIDTNELDVRLQSETVETLRFCVPSSDKVATSLTAPNVRIRTLKRAGVAREDKIDVLIVTVKAYDSAQVLYELWEKHRHLLQKDALCVLLQNGLGELPTETGGELSHVANQWQFLHGVTYIGGRVIKFGSVVASGLANGTTYFAPIKKAQLLNQSQDGATHDRRNKERDARMKVLGQLFHAAGLRCEVLETRSMQTLLWQKLIVNAAINPLASVLNASNGCLASSKGSRSWIKMVVHEALAVAHCEKISMTCTPLEFVDQVVTVAKNTGPNVCSMLADLRRGSRTEIDAITGRIVAGGERHGVATPVNKLLLSLVHKLEREGTRKEK